MGRSIGETGPSIEGMPGSAADVDACPEADSRE